MPVFGTDSRREVNAAWLFAWVRDRFPDQAVNLGRKLDHARAEAMLIANYGAEWGRSP
jgi:hypothetical protein